MTTVCGKCVFDASLHYGLCENQVREREGASDKAQCNQSTQVDVWGALKRMPINLLQTMCVVLLSYKWNEEVY